MLLPRRMIRMCRRALWRWKVADSTGAELSGGKLLTGIILLRRLLLRQVLAPEDEHVGILLPPSVGGVVVNAAVTLAGRISANLNYSAPSSINNACIERANIRRVLTSRKVFDKLQLDLDAEIVYLDDLRASATRIDMLVSAAMAYCVPAGMLDRWFKLDQIKGDDVLTVIFTSGSTGVPKGVMLTHGNIATNVQAIATVVDPQPPDTILGILPFFHSFGFMVTLWGLLGLDIRAVYHFTPLDARAIGKLARERRPTILLATPTFLRSYWKRCEPDDFASLDVVVAGAEKLPSSLCDAFEEKFGVRPVEGYGATELSPLVSVNVPPSRSKTKEADAKEGTVGRPIPNVSAKTVDPETMEDLPPGEEGMLMIRGPNVMKGYLGEVDKTAEVIREGWYVTGDMARIDDEGFIEITGRLSRFSKIGGEMVPHVRVEAVLQGIVGNDDEQQLAVVTAVPDERKGERLVVVHRPLPMTPAEITSAMADVGLPNLWIPSNDCFIEVEEIPVLGSGKTDLKALAELAREKMAVG